MKVKFSKGLDEKQIVAQKLENKRIEMWDVPESMSGPFTNAGDVESYLNSSIQGELKKKRMEILPPVRSFKSWSQTKKRRDKLLKNSVNP